MNMRESTQMPSNEPYGGIWSVKECRDVGRQNGGVWEEAG